MKASQCPECERLRVRLEQVREALAEAREALLTMCGAEQIPALMSEIDAALAAGDCGVEPHPPAPSPSNGEGEHSGCDHPLSTGGEGAGG